MDYKIIVLDLDGTLTNRDKIITPRTKEALMKAQEAGKIVVLASGRPTAGVEPLAKELDLARFGSYILSYNGGMITNCKTGEVIFSSLLPVESNKKIMDLAKQLIRFYGYEPGVNMEIKIVGLRPGEKLYEELMMDEEQDKMRRTQHNKIFVASPRSIDLAEFYGQLQELAAAAEHNDEGVVQQLAKMIPTFTPTRQNLKL